MNLFFKVPICKIVDCWVSFWSVHTHLLHLLHPPVWVGTHHPPSSSSSSEQFRKNNRHLCYILKKVKWPDDYIQMYGYLYIWNWLIRAEKVLRMLIIFHHVHREPRAVRSVFSHSHSFCPLTLFYAPCWPWSHRCAASQTRGRCGLTALPTRRHRSRENMTTFLSLMQQRISKTAVN